jgi:hypothetical protein
MPEPPNELGAAGRDLWDSVTGRYELETHEAALLTEAVRTLDHLAALDLLVRTEGRVIETPQGARAHPALVEGRQQRMAFSRLLAALRLPSDDGTGKASRPQKRGGMRAPYSIRPGA